VAVDSTMLPSDVSWNLYKALTTVESGEQLPLASDTAAPHIAESLPRRTVSVGSEQSQIHTISSQSLPYSLLTCGSYYSTVIINHSRTNSMCSSVFFNLN